jgi:hypothetical protein
LVVSGSGYVWWPRFICPVAFAHFARELDTEKCGAPAALAIITGTGYGYTRDDGIQVVPIGALGP